MRVYRSVVRAIEPSHAPDYYWENGHQSITVLEDDTARNTGILDERGNPIMSQNVMAPIGFNRS